MDLAAVKVETVFRKINFSGPFNAEQKSFLARFPEVLNYANKSEYLFFKKCNKKTVYAFIKAFRIVTNKNLEFIKDIVDGNASKIKRFLRINRSKKDDTTLRIAVTLSCSLKQAEVLDFLVKNLTRAFLSKFEHIFLALAIEDHIEEDVTVTVGNSAGFATVLRKWCGEKKIDFNTPFYEDDEHCPHVKTLFFSVGFETIILSIDKEVIKVDTEEWVEMFNFYSLAQASSGSGEGEDIFQVFPAHDYFLEKLSSDLEFNMRLKFYEDSLAASNGIEVNGMVTYDKVDAEEGNAEIQTDTYIGHEVMKIDNKETKTNPNMDCEGKVPESKSLSEKFGIRRDINDEDLIEIMELLDKVISVTIRDILKYTLVDKLVSLQMSTD